MMTPQSSQSCTLYAPLVAKTVPFDVTDHVTWGYNLMSMATCSLYKHLSLNY